MGPAQDKRDQLLRYLDLPVDGVLYVRSSWKPPQEEVLRHPKYIRPSSREHFLWRDFYHLLDVEDHVFLQWLKQGFERLGFTPPQPSVGEFQGPDHDTNTRNRRNFAKLWQSTRTFARNLGWKVEAGSIVELYMKDSPSPLASNIWVCPVKFDRFLIRVTPWSGMLNVTLEAMRDASLQQPIPTEVRLAEILRKNGMVSVVDLTTSLFEILGKEPQSADAMERKLFAYLTHFLTALQR